LTPLLSFVTINVMLRVITGTAKGTHLKVPETGLRPATDLVRGSIFTMLENLTDDWFRVLDMFSGSGAFGIEALSRGAGWVDFVDREPRCCAIIKLTWRRLNSALSHMFTACLQRKPSPFWIRSIVS